jgi:asparagine synthetase B (glutamine-hydrolysing)
MWLMARVIKSMGIKMVLSGEGADELLEDICISTKRQTQENSTKKTFVN